ncbi:hypothetical protein ACPFUC_001891 [Vibrio cholerae]|jgi:hypothetical protein|nr:hypothetical protein [Vibrio cholerae]
MKYLVAFDEDPFEGKIWRISSNKDLYQIVHDRTYLLGHLNDNNGKLLSEEHFTEEQLLEIYRQVSWADQIHLVNTLDDLRSLSTHPRYQTMLDSLKNSV